MLPYEWREIRIMTCTFSNSWTDGLLFQWSNRKKLNRNQRDNCTDFRFQGNHCVHHLVPFKASLQSVPFKVTAEQKRPLLPPSTSDFVNVFLYPCQHHHRLRKWFILRWSLCYFFDTLPLFVKSMHTMHKYLLSLVLLLSCLQGFWCKKSALVRLDEDSWSQLLTGEWMVEL